MEVELFSSLSCQIILIESYLQEQRTKNWTSVLQVWLLEAREPVPSDS